MGLEPTHQYVLLSARWKSMIGYEDDEFPNQWRLGPNTSIPKIGSACFNPFSEYLQSHARTSMSNFGCDTKIGNYRWILLRGAVQRDTDGKPYHLAGSHTDITERMWFQEQIELQITHVNEAYVELEAQRVELAAANSKLHQANMLLQTQATTDGLTELKNHRAFQERLVTGV